jgi:CheY-like chemotaxis protein
MDEYSQWLVAVSGALLAAWLGYRAIRHAAAQRKAKRAAADAAERLEARRQAAEESTRRQTEQAAAARQAARIETARLAQEEASRAESESEAAEQAALVAEAFAAAEASAQGEAAREAAANAPLLEAARVAAEEAARAEAERLAAQEAFIAEALRLAEEDAARAQAAQLAADEARALAARQLEEDARRASARESASAPTSEQPPDPKRPDQTLVMVADDSKVVRVVTGRLLSKHQYRVSYATDGLDAVRQMQADAPDILITDVEMPGMDGFELARHVRHDPLTAHIPIIMITASDDRHREEAHRAGVSVLLGKPYPEDELIGYIQRAMSGEALVEAVT